MVKEFLENSLSFSCKENEGLERLSDELENSAPSEAKTGIVKKQNKDKNKQITINFFLFIIFEPPNIRLWGLKTPSILLPFQAF
jgi:hypothetical protein